MKDIVELLMHWHAGRPKVVVAASLGTDPKTVRKYVAKAEQAGIIPGGPVLSRAEWGALVRGWFPELVETTTASSPDDRPRASDTDAASNRPLNATTQSRVLAA